MINRIGEGDAIDDVEGYDLPILQDTEAVDVFSLYGANSYDLFIIDRDGNIAEAMTGAHPIEQRDEILEMLSQY